MPNPDPIVRQEHLHGLRQFCLNLSEALNRIIPDEGRRQAVVRTSLSGECVLCGLTVNGEELLQIGTRAAEESAPNPKIDRLRRGYCGRNGCESCFYRLTFQPYPELDWTQAFAQSETVQEEQEEQARAEAGQARAWKRAQRWRLAGRVGIGLIVLCVLYVIRQWYIGGTIPILREPQKFRADPASFQQGPL